MIVSLFLRNFRRFEEVNVTFSPGMNGLFGENYAGKTTLVLAIAVAIGGPSYLRGYHLARDGQDQFEIQAVLELGDQQYRILRTKSGAKLWRVGKEDKLIASGQTQVNIELGKLLGMPVERWLELRFVRQKQASQMFEAGATKLNLLVEELTGVNTISYVIKQLSETHKTESAALEALQQQVGGQDMNELTDERAQLKHRREKVEQAAADFDAAHARANEQLQAVGLKILGIETKIAGQRDLLRDARDLTRDITSLGRQLADLQPPARRTAQIEEELVQVNADLKVFSEWLSNVAAAERELATANRKKNLYREAKETIDEGPLGKTVGGLLGEREAAGEKAAETRTAARRLEEQLVELDSQLADGVCSSCQRPFDDDAEHREALGERKKTLHAEFTAAANARDAAASELSRLTADLKFAEQQLSSAIASNREAETHNAGRQVAVTAYDEALAALQEIESMHEAGKLDAEQKVEACEARVKALTKERSFVEYYDQGKQKLEDDLAKAKRQLEQLQAKHTLMEESDLIEHEESLRTLTEERVGVVAEVRSAKQGAEQARSQAKDLARDVDRAQKRIEALEAAQDDLEVRAARLANIDGLRKYLRDNRSRYLQSAWELILGRASAFASATTDGYISEIRRTEAGAFEFIELDRVAEVNEASGAQQALLGLGIQVALAETLPTTLDLFLADEPTADMDADHSAATLLNLSAVAKQAIVISHHRMDESLCSEVMELVR